ncbi:DUF1796 family putative cysteine peptidase [Phenylobacterium immobile]|uniref:DUF1796 family putative cysteine peptidase n=1 Tax=Phenylobacterium immobile TaxID=21 RepID=UPI000ACF3C33|nr:DUF1796 family putative cysteine peptidase [Phenylobacterium immobile]
MNKRIELVLSLGGLCQVSYQIERRLGFHYHSPFDWLVAPLSSIRRVLADEGQSFCQAVSVTHEGRTPLCESYGVAYAHEFHRTDGGAVIIDRATMQKAQEKLAHKYSVMRELLAEGHRTLFIRLAGHHDGALATPYVVDDRPCTTQDLNAICEAVAGRFPDLEFEIAFAYFSEFTQLKIDESSLDPRLRVFALESSGGGKWQGAEENWAPLFDAYDFDLKAVKGKSRQFSKKYQLDAQELR